jgi:hypothetical protein
VDLLVDKANVTDRNVTKEELVKPLDGDEEAEDAPEGGAQA